MSKDPQHNPLIQREDHAVACREATPPLTAMRVIACGTGMPKTLHMGGAVMPSAFGARSNTAVQFQSRGYINKGCGYFLRGIARRLG